MKTALFTLMDDNFIKAFQVFWKTFSRHNQWFDHDFIILDVGLSKENREFIQGHYDKIIFRDVQIDNYFDINFDNTHDRLKKTFYFLDAFCQFDYDMIVSIDMDMLVLGSIKPVFDNATDGFSACGGYAGRADKVVNQVNAGLFIVGKKYLNPETYDGLLAIAKVGHSMPEQKTMNIYFDGVMDYIPKIYNVEKRLWKTKKYKDIKRDAVIWHYVGLKPWEDHTGCRPNELGYEELEKMWLDEYES